MSGSTEQALRHFNLDYFFTGWSITGIESRFFSLVAPLDPVSLICLLIEI